MAQIHAQTETAVANEALSHLLLPAITDLDSDTSYPAKVLRLHFAGVRDAMQRQFPWNYCEREATLNVDPSATASFRFAYIYALPNAPYCLAARSLQHVHRRHWKVVGRSLQSNVGPTVNLIYTARIESVAQWDSMFRTAFALALAVACKVLCKDLDIIGDVEKAARAALDAAWPVDAAEGTADELPDQDIIAIRDGCYPRTPWSDC